MKQKTRLLIAGGGYADIPLIEAARKLGFMVITTGNRPADLGHQHADAYHMADFSSPHAMLAIASELRIDAICPCCNDFSALSCAFVAEQMGLPGHDPFEVSAILHHKDRYRAFAAENGIPTPRAISASNEEDAFRAGREIALPLIIKPVDLTGGKGIRVVHSYPELIPAIKNAFQISRAKRIVIEQFLHGTRHGFSAFIQQGHVAFDFADNEHYYLNPHLVAAASTPATVPDEVRQELRRQAEKISGLLRLKDGIFHVQYILTPDGPVIIEICRRGPGDLYIRLVEHATGVDYARWIVSAAAGIPVSGIKQVVPRMSLVRHCAMASRKGHLNSVTIDPGIRNRIIDQMMWWKPGEIIEDEMTHKFGIVFVKFDSQDEMLATADHLHEMIHADIA